MTDDVDRELERRFADLARFDEETAPGFESVLGRAPVRVPSRVSTLARAAVVAAAVSIAVLTLTSVLWIQRSRRHDASADSVASVSTITAWRSPTSTLLETPGLDLLQGTPALATPADASSDSPPTTPATPRPLSKGAAS